MRIGSRGLTAGLLGAALGACAAVATPAVAQGRPVQHAAAGPSPGGPPSGRAAETGTDEEMRAALEQVMLVRLKRTLALTPDQEARVMPKVASLLGARHEVATRRRATVSHLRAVMIDATSSDAEILKALKDVQAVDDGFREQEQDMRREIDRELTPRQQARLYFFEEHFRRAMQRRMMEAMQHRGPGGPPAAPGQGHPAAPEADDDTTDEGGQ